MNRVWIVLYISRNDYPEVIEVFDSETAAKRYVDKFSNMSDRDNYSIQDWVVHH